MKRKLMWLAVLSAAGHWAWGQNAPHLAYALPAGGQQGTTVQIVLGGQFLQNVTDVYISGQGVSATAQGFSRPMNGNEATDLNERMQALLKLPMDAAVFQEMVDIRVKLLTFNTTRLISPVLAENVKLQIAISPTAVPGKRELRVATAQGLSNPLMFCVGQLPEVTEEEKIDVIGPPNGQMNPNLAQVKESATNMHVTLPATINGRIKPGLMRIQPGVARSADYTPGEADRYRFEARKGEELVIAASARDLMPYLADAVPGWFQAVLTLYDSRGKEVAYNDDYRFHPDPMIHYAVPEDGEYTAEIKDALYRGREDFVYRIAIGELPFVTGIFPLGGRAGTKTAVELSGWNLPVKTLTMDASGEGPGIYPLTTHDGDRLSNAVPFQVETLPEVVEKEPNDTRASAQRVKLPVIVNGRIGRPGDWDVYRFEGRARQTIVAEVYARRLDSPLDSVLKLTDASGKQLAFNDDYEDPGAGLETHHADSRILATLPANGTYFVQVGDIQRKGGAEYAYRLRIGTPRPDFELRVAPSAINVGPGITVPLTVRAIRKDGFGGEIALSLKGAANGLHLDGGLIPAGQDEVRATLSAPPQQPREPLSVELEGKSTIEEHVVSRMAVPADDMMQAFFYHHLVPAAGLKVVVRRGTGLRTPAKLAGPVPLRLSAGNTARLRVQVPLAPNSQIDRVQYELSDPPEGIAIQDTAPVQGGAEIVLQCDGAKAKPGTKGNLIITITAERTPPAASGRPAGAKQRIPLGTLPAVPFEIAP